MILDLLAQTAAAQNPDTFSGEMLIKILGAIAALVGAVYGGTKLSKSQPVKIDPLPLPVKMEDHFVTRREFDSFKTEMRVDVTDIKGLFGRLTDKFDERDKRYQDKFDERDQKLSNKIEAVASGAYEARRRIHEKLNDQSERVKSLEDRTPIKRPSHP
jgi:hypothetical protein